MRLLRSLSLCACASVFFCTAWLSKVSHEPRCSATLISDLRVGDIHELIGVDEHKYVRTLSAVRNQGCRIKHVILVEDFTSRSKCVEFRNRHLSSLPHVRVLELSRTMTLSARVMWVLDTQSRTNFFLLWDFIRLQLADTAFKQLFSKFKVERSLALFSLANPSVMSHYVTNLNLSRVPVDRFADFETNIVRPVGVDNNILLVAATADLFQRAGAFSNFSLSGLSCFMLRAAIHESSKLYELPIPPDISIRHLHTGIENEPRAKKSDLGESCRISNAVTHLISPDLAAARGARVALVHEMCLWPNQGGNIRLLRIVESLLANFLDVDVFVRVNLEQDTSIRIGYQALRCYKDNMQLSRFSKRVQNYDIILSAMWFWNHERSVSAATIPILVDHFLRSALHPTTHIVVTDDLHFSRCMKTNRNNKLRECHRIYEQERMVWSCSRILKIFVSEEDLKFALKSCPAAHGSMTFLPYAIASSTMPPVDFTPFQKQHRFVYMGKAHEANIQAVGVLLSTFAKLDAKLKVKSQLFIVGDEKWEKIIRKRIGFWLGRRLPLRFPGEVSDLDELLRTVEVALIPVTVGDTGVSSKIFKCIELQVPFVSTAAGMRGFECDDDCKALFFANSEDEILDYALRAVYDPEWRVHAVIKLREISDSLAMKTLATNKNVVSALKGDFPLSVPGPIHGRVSSNIGMACHECTENCEEICNIRHNGEHQHIVLSVYCSLLGTDSEERFVPSYISDVLQQDFAEPWEIIMASSNPHVLDAVRFALLQSPHATMPKSLTVRTVLLSFDHGLYETWDYIIKSISTGEFLTNWNVDDKKHPSALSMKVNALRSDPEIGVVSSAVYATSVENFSWKDCDASVRLHRDQLSKSKLRCEFWFDFEGSYSLSAFLQTDPETARLNGNTQNYPHNAPVYRRSIHAQIGYFSGERPYENSTTSAPTCFDWKFWTTAARNGARFEHINLPLEVYFVRPDSHQRRNTFESESCVDAVLTGLRDEGLYNNVFFWGFENIHKMHKRLLIVVSANKESVSPLVLRFQLWLNMNGHTVHTLEIGGSESSPTASPATGFYDLVFFDLSALQSVQMRHPWTHDADLLTGAVKVGLAVSPWNRYYCGFSACDHVLRLDVEGLDLSDWVSIKIGSSPGAWPKSRELLKLIHHVQDVQVLRLNHRKIFSWMSPTQ